MSTHQLTPSNRNIALDALKAIAIICVLFIHASASGLSNLPLGSRGWFYTAAWAVVSRFAVPVFLMVSGALLLNPEKSLTIKKLFSKNLLRIIVALLLWATIYEAYGIYLQSMVQNDFTLALVKAAIKNILTFDTHFHLYYLHITILVYLFLPITRLFTLHASRVQLKYALCLWFCLGILYPFLRKFYPLNLITGIPTQFAINMTYSAIGYGLMGFYLHRYKPYNWIAYASLFIVGTCVVGTGVYYTSMRAGHFNPMFLEGMSPGVAIMAIGTFGGVVHFFERYTPTKIIAVVITYLSASSFSVFLVHDVFNIYFREHGFKLASWSPLIALPTLVGLNLILSLCVYEFLRRMPVLRKIH